MSEDKSPVEGAFGNSDLCRLEVERAGKGGSGVGLYCGIGLYRGIGLYCGIATPDGIQCVFELPGSEPSSPSHPFL